MNDEGQKSISELAHAYNELFIQFGWKFVGERPGIVLDKLTRAVLDGSYEKDDLSDSRYRSFERLIAFDGTLFCGSQTSEHIFDLLWQMISNERHYGIILDAVRIVSHKVADLRETVGEPIASDVGLAFLQHYSCDRNVD